MGNSNEEVRDGLSNSVFQEVPFLDREETETILSHYKELGALYDSIEGSKLEKKFFLSGGVPENLLECVIYDSVY